MPYRFTAALNQARGAVYIYSKFVFTHAALLLLSLGLMLYTTLRPDNSDPNAVGKCLNGSTSPIISQFCNQNLSLVRILSIALLGAAILVQFCALTVACPVGPTNLSWQLRGSFRSAMGRSSTSKLWRKNSPTPGTMHPIRTSSPSHCLHIPSRHSPAAGESRWAKPI
jgi:hypothetical protein